jgi:cellulose synthase/poly-beta-1,6-N-acetylglucosamine synthase-like glycosyltransferase
MPDLSALEIAFWLLALLMLYTLQGYPILLSILASFRKERQFPPTAERPIVTFIVAAYNEERNIAAKIDNLKQIDYDSDKIEFIIGSDASIDDTDRIISDAAQKDPRLRFFRLDRRGGKIAVLHRAVEMARGKILIFTDCSVRTDPDIMPIILSSFGDDRVGLVSSRDVWVDEARESPVSQHQYIDYEMKIRKMESRLNSLVSASGSFFAVRRELFKGYGGDQADDFALPLQVYRQGYKVIHRDDLIGYVPMVKSSEAEFNRRRRIVQAGIRTVLDNCALLNPLRYPLFSWQLWSHKVLKWLFPFMAAAELILALTLSRVRVIYDFVIIGYAIVGLIAIIAVAAKNVPSLPRPLRIISFIMISMEAVLAAWYNVVTGKGAKTWEPTHR